MTGRRLLPALGLTLAGAAVVFATVALPSGTPGPTFAPPSSVPGLSDTVPTTIAATAPPATLPPATVAPSSTASPTSSPPTTAFRPQPPLFGEAAGVTLVFDGGGDAVLAIDPDQRLAARTTVTGLSGGDPPYRLIEVAGRLVVGWNRVYAVDVATGDAVELGRATIYVPAAEPGRVWLVRYPQGFIGGGQPEVWQVDMQGEALTEPVVLDVPGFPAIGIPEGIAVETDDGVALWDAASGEVTARLGAGHAFVADVAGSRIAWCDDACTEMRITDLRSGSELVAATPAAAFTQLSFGARSARFSPDWRHLAALSGNALVLIDTATGSAAVVARAVGADLAYVEWSRNGRQVFAAPSSFSEATVQIVRYDLAAQQATVASLPFGGTLGFVVLDTSDSATLLAPAEDCRPPGITTARPFCARF